MPALQKISPFLGFDSQVEYAVKPCISIFPNSKIISRDSMGAQPPA